MGKTSLNRAAPREKNRLNSLWKISIETKGEGLTHSIKNVDIVQYVHCPFIVRVVSKGSLTTKFRARGASSSNVIDYWRTRVQTLISESSINKILYLWKRLQRESDSWKLRNAFFLFEKKERDVIKIVVFKWGNPPPWPCYSDAFQKVNFFLFPVSAVHDFFFRRNFWIFHFHFIHFFGRFFRYNFATKMNL